MICAYVLGQSVADVGKEKTTIEAELADKAPSEKAAAIEAEL